MVWAGFCSQEKLPLMFIEAALNAQRYCDM